MAPSSAVQAVGSTRPATVPAKPDPWLRWRIPLLVAVIALVIRLATVLRGGGLYGYQGYDDGVYFGAAASFVFGRLPYRDFVLLHPPGIMLALSPFALLGRLTSDRDAMALARVVWLLLGAVNAGLTARVAGVLGRGPALVAGGFVAVWVQAVYADRATLLEPIGTLLLLCALLLLRRPGPRPWTGEVLAGLAFGLSAAVKVWAAVSIAVVAVALLLERGWRSMLRLGTAAALAAAAVCLPFFVAAPKAMVRMVVLDQSSRPEIGPSALARPRRILGFTFYLSGGHARLVVVLTVVLCVLLLALTLIALRERTARLWVALLVAHGAVVLAAPVYFAHYAAFLAAPLGLVLGAATAVIARELRARAPGALGRRLTAALAATAAVALVVVGGATAAERFGARFPGRQLAAFVPEAGCVRADDPGALVQLDVLSRDLRRGCTVHVDFTGITYDRLARTGPNGRPVARIRNAAWQRHARAYLMSGSATVLVRGAGNRFNATTTAQLRALPVLGQVGRWKVLGPPRRQPAPAARAGAAGAAAAAGSAAAAGASSAAGTTSRR